MPDTLSAAALRLASWLAAGKLGLARHYVEWSIRCPSIGADSAITAMAQEEIGHAAILRPAGGELLLPGFDELEPPLLRTPLASWAGLIGTASVLEAVLTAVVEDLAGGRCTVLARRVPKMVAEERFHAQFLQGWVAELRARPGGGTELAGAVDAAVQAVRPWAASGAGDPALPAEGVVTRPVEALIGAAIEGVVRRCRPGAA